MNSAAFTHVACHHNPHRLQNCWRRRLDGRSCVRWRGRWAPRVDWGCCAWLLSGITGQRKLVASGFWRRDLNLNNNPPGCYSRVSAFMLLEFPMVTFKRWRGVSLSGRVANFVTIYAVGIWCAVPNIPDDRRLPAATQYQQQSFLMRWH